MTRRATAEHTYHRARHAGADHTTAVSAAHSAVAQVGGYQRPAPYLTVSRWCDDARFDCENLCKS